MLPRYLADNPMTSLGAAEPAELAGVVEELASLIGQHARPLLAFSGGAESSLLLDLLAPFKDRLTLLWVNSFALPHMVEFVRRKVEGWHFIELWSDPFLVMQEHGIPAFLVEKSAGFSLSRCPWMIRSAPFSIAPLIYRLRAYPRATGMPACDLHPVGRGQRWLRIVDSRQSVG